MKTNDKLNCDINFASQCQTALFYSACAILFSSCSMDSIKELTKSNAPDFIASMDTFLIDCDGLRTPCVGLFCHSFISGLQGVIWRGNEAVEGAQDALAQLRKQVLNVRLWYMQPFVQWRVHVPCSCLLWYTRGDSEAVFRWTGGVRMDVCITKNDCGWMSKINDWTLGYGIVHLHVFCLFLFLLLFCNQFISLWTFVYIATAMLNCDMSGVVGSCIGWLVDGQADRWRYPHTQTFSEHQVMFLWSRFL